MEHYLELRAKIDDVRREGLAIFDKAQEEERDLTKEEDARLETLKNRRNKLERECDLYVQNKGLQSQIDAMANGKPVTLMDSPGDRIQHERTYRSLFYGDGAAALSNGEFDNFGEFVEVLSSGRFDPRLRASTRAMTEGVPSEGGFLVPEEYSAMLLDAALESEVVRPRATVYKMERQTRKVPGWDGFDHTSNLFGGFSGNWLSEGGSASRQNARLRQIQLTAKKLGIYTQASRELVEDGMSYGEQISGAMTQAIGWFLGHAFLQGTGAGQPLGVLNDPALVTVSKETGQPASTFLYENVTKMLARLHPSAFRGAIWAANQTVLPQLMEMSLSVGTGGAPIKAVEERNGRFYLLGKELAFTEKLPTLGSKGDVLLADFSKYVIGMRQEVVLDKSNAPGWTEDMQDFRVILRADGMGSWSQAVTPKNGDSVSWCVVLQART